MQPLTLAELSDSLLPHLREAFGCASLTYAEPPSVIKHRYALVCALRLDGAPEELSGPLVVRMMNKGRQPVGVRYEQAIHTALREQGYPTPRVLLASQVDGPAGRPFILMERVEGAPMTGSSPGLVTLLRLPGLIVKAQAHLHGLDAERFLDAMEQQGYRRRQFSLDYRVKRITQRMERKGFDWLRPAIAWLQEHQPPEQDTRVVCHGDLHGRNALSRGGSVTGVIDWQSVVVADPMLDVGNTMMSIVPSRGLSPTVRLFSGVLRRRVQAQYLRAYGRTRPVRMESVRYYAALRLMSRLVRRKTPDAARAASFYDLTGVRLELPLP